MSAFLYVLLFLFSLACTFAAAGFFARRLDRVGLRLGLPETLLGLLTALAADAPELASAIAALVTGAHGVGVGVVVGSNVFNLASMVGLTALLCGSVRLHREALALEAFVGVPVLLAAAALVAGWLAPAAAIAIIALVLVPYVGVLVLGPRGVLRLPVARGTRAFLQRSFGELHRRRGAELPPAEKVLRPALLLVPALAIIVAGSTGMVEAALHLADDWTVPRYLVGVVVLAVLTSLPNAFTALRLGLQGRGSALLSETLNSNTINLVAGIAIPALILTLGSFSGLVAFDLLWLIAMTALVVALLAREGGVGRPTGALLVVLYGVFLAVQVATRT
jgi:cation:H+ antiporter